MTDEESVTEWLEKQDHPTQVWFAARCALRLAPKTLLEGKSSFAYQFLTFCRSSITVSCYPHAKEATLKELDSHARSSILGSQHAGESEFSGPAHAAMTDALATALAKDGLISNGLRASTSSIVSAKSALNELLLGLDRHDAAIAIVADTSGPRSWCELVVRGPDTSTAAQDWARLFAQLRSQPDQWSFWLEWYEAILIGQPLPWDLSFRIATELTDEDWEKGGKDWDASARHVAERIKEIRAAWLVDSFPQVETLIKSEDSGLYDVRAVAVSAKDQLASIVSQTRFALETASRGNSGLNPYCIPYRYILHACEVCPEDANMVEQHFSLAAQALEKGLTKGKYQEDEGIEELIGSLKRHALQLRSDHKDVGQAYVTRLAQTFRELEDEAALKLADATGEYAETTEGRLERETRLDQQTLASDEAPEVKAEALKRVAGRASKQSLMERASDGIKAVDKSGGVTSAKLGYSGYKIIEVVTRHWPF